MKQSLFQIFYGYLLYWIIIIFLINIAFGCGSKKKTIEQSKSEVVSNATFDSTTSLKLITEDKLTTLESAKETEKHESFEYTGEKGDSLKVIKKGADGKILSETIYTGKGKASFTSKQKTSETTADKIATFTKQNEENTAVKITQAETKNSTAKKVTATKSGVTIYTWLKLSLILVLVSGLYYVTKRFNIIKRVTRLFFN